MIITGRTTSTKGIQERKSQNCCDYGELSGRNEERRGYGIIEYVQGGWWRAVYVGPRAFFCQPISEEARVKVEVRKGGGRGEGRGL